MFKKRHKVLVIVGPTSTGKTDTALRLANKFNGELVSCDSRQVYEGLDIGTGKAPDEELRVNRGKGYWEINGIKIWMYDVIDSKKQYTVYNYVQDADKVIDEIIKRGNLPIIVGGTGLYLKALLEGLTNLGVPIDQKLRKELEKLSLQELQERLQRLSPNKWVRMNNADKQNPRRLIRAIELAMSNHEVNPSQSLWDDNLSFKNVPKLSNEDVLKIGLTAPREILYQRIDERVIRRIKQGLINEAVDLYKKGLSLKRMRQLGLEYGALADFLEGKIVSREDLITHLQGKIHGYARRQITWYKKETNVLWFDITQKNWLDEVERQVHSWYYSLNDQTN